MYHSKFASTETSTDIVNVGNIAILPLKTNVKGPAPRMQDSSDDVIDEALLYFKPVNSLNFEEMLKLG